MKSVAPCAEIVLRSLHDLGHDGSALADIFRFSNRVALLTGAGLSTGSGIPDYRSPGRGPYRPLQHSEFMTNAAVRQRYWSRSFLGWDRMKRAAPNAGHFAITALQKAGFIHSIITQNVDRMHSRAGSTNIVELHGNIHEVICLQCSHQLPRTIVQAMMAEANAEWSAKWLPQSTPRPDGDMEVPAEAIPEFIPPQCLTVKRYC